MRIVNLIQKTYDTKLQRFDGIVEGITADNLKKLFLNRDLGDDALNTLCKFENISNSVPGECDFINKLYPDKPTMRLYCGKGLNFYDSAIRDNCLNVFNSVFKEKLSRKLLEVTPEQKLNYHIISNMTLHEDIKKEINEIKSFFLQDTKLLPQQMYYKMSQIDSNLYELNQKLRKQILNNESLNEEKIKGEIQNARNNLQNFKTQTIDILEREINETIPFYKLNDLVSFEKEIFETKLNNIEDQLKQLKALTTFQIQLNKDLGITVNESILNPFEDYSSAIKNLQANIKALEALI